nr:hypothetical protein [Candidatus Sigynarchaeota archaeon]
MFTTENFKFFKNTCHGMNIDGDQAVIVEYTSVSDKDFKPINCIACGHDTLACCNHKIIDRQDLGTPT